MATLDDRGATDVKILQLHASYRLQAGEERVIANEAKVLREAGHDVDQFIEPNPQSASSALGSLARSLHNRKMQRNVAEVIERKRPDVVHVHNTWYSLSSAALTAVKEADVPIVRTLHNYRTACIGADLFRDDNVCTACVGRSPIRGVLHGCYRGSRPLSAIAGAELVANRRRGVQSWLDLIIAPSEFMADRLVETGIPREQIHVKTHFTYDVGERSAPPSASDEVLFVGRLAQGKGLTTLMRSWEQLTGRTEPHGTTRLTIVGAGPLDTPLREMAPRNVHFAGWTKPNEALDMLRSARALVFPSTWFEPFGMVLIEALSAGVPIVATRVGAAASISAAPDELLAAPEDTHSLTNALRQLNDDEFVDRVGAANRARFEQNFSPASGAAALEAAYDIAIERHARGSA